MVLPSLVAGRGGIAHGNGITSFVAQDRETQSVERWMKELRVKASHMDQLISELSGGNQQKVVLAKWLMTEPEILFLDEPTRGIDVGAKVEIYQWIQKLAAEGIAVMVASSEMPELLGVCHRLLVLREGHLSADLPAEAATQEDIMRAASL
jgi:ABC-type sugar transport system ATPase subunit